eukprot:6197720-Pleurochrysis_carterae.AAC.2
MGKASGNVLAPKRRRRRKTYEVTNEGARRRRLGGAGGGSEMFCQEGGLGERKAETELRCSISVEAQAAKLAPTSTNSRASVRRQAREAAER